MVAGMGKRHDIIIIGAGISGLSLAFYCARAGLSTLVIEKSGRVGGAFRTHHFRDGTSDFWLELAAHTCYNSYQNLIEIIEECNVADRLLPRAKVPFMVFTGNRLKSMASQIRFPELLGRLPRLLFTKKAGLSVAAYYAQVLGKRNYRNLFRHVFNGVISQEADDFPAEMIFKKRLRRKDVLKSFSFKNGLQSLAEAIAAHERIEVATDTEVCEIDHDNGRYRLIASDGASYETEAFGVATGVATAARLLKAPFSEIGRQLAAIATATVESVGVVIDKNKVAIPPVAGIIAKDDVFYSAVSRDTVEDSAFRGFTFHFKPGLLDRQGKLKRIGEVLRVEPGRFAQIIAQENSVPTLKMGHEAIISAIDRQLAGKRLLLTGNYFSGLAIEDCVSRSLGEFLRLKMLRSDAHFKSTKT